jgi:hypothetical protein
VVGLAETRANPKNLLLAMLLQVGAQCAGPAGTHDASDPLLDLRDQCLRDLHDLLPAGGGQHELGAAVAAAPDPDMSAVLAIAARKGIEMLDPLTEPG